MKAGAIRGLLALVIAGIPLLAHAQNYPARPIRIMIGFPAGGGSDVAFRKIAERMAARVSQGVIIENRAGAGSAIAAQAVVQAPPDGYTLYGAGTSMATFKIFNKDLTFDVQKDLAPITRVVDTAYAIVINTKSPAKNLKEFIDWAKANPGKLNYGSPGGAVRLAMELFFETTGVKMFHVQYKGEADYATALLQDQVQAVFGSPPTYKPNVEAGKLRIVAVTTANRVSGIPDVPTVSESGYSNFVIGNWYGVLAPAGTPRDIIGKLNSEFAAVVNSEEYKQYVAKTFQGAYFPVSSTPEEFARFIDSEIRRLTDVAQRSKIDS